MPRRARVAPGGMVYHHHTTGTGHLYQGRFNAFPVQTDGHFLTVCRYVERNAPRAGPHAACGGRPIGYEVVYGIVA